ncbi:MAG: hypothetical protein IPP94_15420, partial [Ignavibacteria bacterium]|nr:hypothetical protein [Ignavibacteria bacterium]
TAITDGTLAPKYVTTVNNRLIANGAYGGSWSEWIDNAITLTGAWPELFTIENNIISNNARAITNLTGKVLYRAEQLVGGVMRVPWMPREARNIAVHMREPYCHADEECYSRRVTRQFRLGKSDVLSLGCDISKYRGTILSRHPERGASDRFCRRAFPGRSERSVVRILDDVSWNKGIVKVNSVTEGDLSGSGTTFQWTRIGDDKIASTRPLQQSRGWGHRSGHHVHGGVRGSVVKRLRHKRGRPHAAQRAECAEWRHHRSPCV